jgi:hypothetical protein
MTIAKWNVICLAGFLFLTVLNFSQTVVADDTAGSPIYNVTGWCGTTEHWMSDRRGAPAGASPNACFQYGGCDEPPVRDTWEVGPDDPFISIRMVVHILRLDDGTGPIAGDAINQMIVDHLNEDYLPSKIQFDVTFNYVNSTEWRTLSESEIDEMKIATAIKPDSFLNVWATEVLFDYSFGTFPFYGDYLEATGGIVMGHFHWQGAGLSVFAHEVGHCLGLYHTFRGVDETSQCGACYEEVGLPPSEGDLRGDFCSDTEPAPMYRTCGDVGGDDPCTGDPWGSTLNQAQSYMSYANSCMEKFTPQQTARMRCWTSSALAGWISNGSFVSDVQLGPAPLDVQFDLFTRHEVLNFDWDFGDGGAAAIEDPIHTFAQTGVRNIGIDLTTPQDMYSLYEPSLIWVYADTIYSTSATAMPGDVVRIDIYANNQLPLDIIQIPFDWSGPLNLKLDSISTTGLRTEYLPNKSFASFNSGLKRATYSMGHGGQPALAPDTGSVLALYFTVPAAAPNGVNPILLAPYDVYNLEFRVPPGAYVPEYASGAITVGSASCCVGETGNINNDPQGDINLTDLTELVNYLFVTFEPLTCPASGNTTGDAACEVNLSDLTKLVNKLFVSFLPNADCSEFDNTLCSN